MKKAWERFPFIKRRNSTKYLASIFRGGRFDLEYSVERVAEQASGHRRPLNRTLGDNDTLIVAINIGMVHHNK